MTAHFSVALEDAQQAVLEDLARQDEVSPGVMLEKLVRDRLDYEAWYRAKVQEGIDAANRGELIPHEEVVASSRLLLAELKEKYGG
ncbi:MAG: hypothetical protein IT546_07295 [Caulobacteraceae bacterium]|nr:hypothetical protein [Caulobacteraceae bacterium]